MCGRSAVCRLNPFRLFRWVCVLLIAVFAVFQFQGLTGLRESFSSSGKLVQKQIDSIYADDSVAELQEEEVDRFLLPICLHPVLFETLYFRDTGFELTFPVSNSIRPFRKRISDWLAFYHSSISPPRLLTS